MTTEFLNSIGSTAEQVAEYIASEGVVGRPRISWWCPVAELLRKKFPLLDIKGSNLFRVFYFSRVGAYVQEPTPEPVREFMRRFDKDEFLYLRRCFRRD